MLSPETRRPTGKLELSASTFVHTDRTQELEEYFCRSLGMALVTLAVMIVVLTGSIPISSLSGERTGVSSDTIDPKAPYAVPALTLTTSFHAASAIYAYTQYLYTGQTSFALSLTANGFLTAMGMWCILFSGSGGHISRRTGADKRTSGFPFSNKEADKRKVGKKRI